MYLYSTVMEILEAWTHTNKISKETLIATYTNHAVHHLAKVPCNKSPSSDQVSPLQNHVVALFHPLLLHNHNRSPSSRSASRLHQTSSASTLITHLFQAYLPLVPSLSSGSSTHVNTGKICTDNPTTQNILACIPLFPLFYWVDLARKCKHLGMTTLGKTSAPVYSWPSQATMRWSLNWFAANFLFCLAGLLCQLSVVYWWLLEVKRILANHQHWWCMLLFHGISSTSSA